MGVLRMMKLFGWEKRANDNVRQKREEELRAVRKRQLLELLSGNMQYVLLSCTDLSPSQLKFQLFDTTTDYDGHIYYLVSEIPYMHSIRLTSLHSVLVPTSHFVAYSNHPVLDCYYERGIECLKSVQFYVCLRYAPRPTSNGVYDYKFSSCWEGVP